MSDGNIYLLLENLSLKDNSDDTGFSNELAPFIEKLSQLARENTYLKISDGSSQEIMKMLESFDVAQMKEKIDTSLSLLSLNPMRSLEMKYYYVQLVTRVISGNK